MNESIIISDKVREQISARAGLVGLGIKIKQLGILKEIEKEVRVAQKTVKYTRQEKLTDALIAILSGAKGLVEVNKRVRSDVSFFTARITLDVAPSIWLKASPNGSPIHAMLTAKWVGSQNQPNFTNIPSNASQCVAEKTTGNGRQVLFFRPCPPGMHSS